VTQLPAEVRYIHEQFPSRFGMTWKDVAHLDNLSVLTTTDILRTTSGIHHHIEKRSMMYTVEEFAADRKVHPETIRRLIKAGKLPAEDLGTGRHHIYRIDGDAARLALSKPSGTVTVSRPAKRLMRPTLPANCHRFF